MVAVQDPVQVAVLDLAAVRVLGVILMILARVPEVVPGQDRVPVVGIGSVAVLDLAAVLDQVVVPVQLIGSASCGERE